MRAETEIYRYGETLTYYREMARQTIANAEIGGDARGKAIKLFYRCDGAIQIINWVLELEANTGFNLPPTIEQREIG
jgi:hypothetical protein